MTNKHSNFDVVIVGGGGSGLAAAIEAANAGAHVTLLERGSTLRGSTGMSVGSITSSQTDLQVRAGVTDTTDEHYADMEVLAQTRNAPDNLELRHILIDEVPDAVRWLTSMGIIFFGPLPEPPHKKPRMHNVLPSSRAYIYYLSRECRRLGVNFVLNARVTSLISENGKVVGVSAKVNGTEQIFRAKKGVILASGDYNGGGILRKTLGGIDDSIIGMNTNSGDGQDMGVSAGSEVLNGHVLRGPLLRLRPKSRSHPIEKLPPWRWLAYFLRFSLEHLPPWLLRPFIMSFVTSWISPDKNLYRQGAILVNRQGMRFTEEMGAPARDVSAQTEQSAFIVMGAEVVKKFQRWPYFVSTAPGVAYAYLQDYRRTRKDVFFEADSLDQLAHMIGIDPKRLRETITDYNSKLATGQLKDRANDIAPIHLPPFCALGPVESFIIITDGGLRVNAQHEVLRSDQTVIEGLYAVGSAGQGGLLLEGHGHHLAWAFVSGRRAGRFAGSRR
ncbi:MAG: FAD-dependent oxidoreductase [Alcaligenaceae bacterium]